MAGVSTETQSRTGRRSLDSEVNMIPMIDLLVCCISFLLITAVWSQMARVPMQADVAGNSDDPLKVDAPDRTLHVEVRNPDAFTLVWRQGHTVVSTAEVPRRAVETVVAGVRQVRYPDLATRMQTEWESNGSHRDISDPKVDRAVLHSQNREVFGDLVAVLDAIHSVRRGVPAANRQAFAVSFSSAD